MQHAMQDIGRQADILMLLLIIGCSLLALPIAWHYSNLDLPLIFSPLLSALAAVLFSPRADHHHALRLAPTAVCHDCAAHPGIAGHD